jgi:hypothetical protein
MATVLEANKGEKSNVSITYSLRSAISITGRKSKMRRRSSPSSQLPGKRVNHHSANRDTTFSHTAGALRAALTSQLRTRMSLHGAMTPAGATSGADARARVSATWRRRRQRRRGKLGDFSRLKQSPSGKILIDPPSATKWAFTWATFHVWAGQATSGKAGMCSHRWIVNGRHQA